ncbi:hypothetical protein ACEN9X_13600 [Mucilaginibacter sp. Mucisp86]|uniref:hypothetical protein n=1 Tax=Mucilaginibacter sp. Mucisp86 TaxID=3243060 RepID=UPI0039B5EA07
MANESEPEKKTTRPTADEISTRKLEAWLGFIKTLGWPLVVLLFLSINCNGIKNIVDEIPQKLQESDKVTVGSLSLEITKRASQLGVPELGEITKGLSAEAIEQLLITGNRINTYPGTVADRANEITVPAGKFKAALLELEKNGLIAFSVPINDFDERLKQFEPNHEHNGSVGNQTGEDERSNYVLTQEQAKEFMSFLTSENYRLTEKGRKAFDLIVSAVKTNIKAD